MTPRKRPLRLGVNIDHVATIRNARGGRHPDPVRAAQLAAQAGADGITAHLREDRRHISDDDISRLSREIDLPLNLEMAATDEMLAIALRHKPHAACLVPEKRNEVTTEGGLDAVRGQKHLAPVIRRLVAGGIRVSLFIDPAERARGSCSGSSPPLRMPRRSASNAMPGTASATSRSGRSPPLPPSSSSISAISSSARRSSAASTVPSSACAWPWIRAAPPRKTSAARKRAMILGIGSDLIDIGRIERTIQRFGDRFLDRVFTPLERERSDRRANRAASYAKRYAAKEACAKALGTGFRRGVYWRDLGVVNLASGRPTLVLTGGALAQLQAITPRGMSARIDLTLTDEPPLAQALVVITAVSS